MNVVEINYPPERIREDGSAVFDSYTTDPARTKPLVLSEKRSNVSGQETHAPCHRGARRQLLACHGLHHQCSAGDGVLQVGRGQQGKSREARAGLGTGRGKTQVEMEGEERGERQSKANGGGQASPAKPQTELQRCWHCSSSSDAVGVRPVWELCWKPRQDCSTPLRCGSTEQHRLSPGGPKWLSPSQHEMG